MDSQYIKCTASGDRCRVARIVAARGLPFAFVKEVREGDLVETVGIVELEYKREVAAWFRDSIGRPDDALLAYAVTTDAREFSEQTARAERIAAAEYAIALRIKRKASKRKAPAAHADSHAAKLAADRSRSRRRRARAQHDAKASIAGAAELLPADETAIPSPAGPGQAG